METTDFTNNSTVTVGTSNIKIFEECFQNLISRTIVNTSTAGQIISVGIGEEAAALQGIVLYPGGVYADISETTYKANKQQINAVSDVAGGTVAIMERIKSGGY